MKEIPNNKKPSVILILYTGHRPTGSLNIGNVHFKKTDWSTTDSKTVQWMVLLFSWHKWGIKIKQQQNNKNTADSKDNKHLQIFTSCASWVPISHCATTSLVFQKNCKQILVLLTSRLNVSFGRCSFSRTSEELPIISMNSDTGWSSNVHVPVTNPHDRSL